MTKPLTEKELNRRRKIRLAIVDFFGGEPKEPIYSQVFRELVANKCKSEDSRKIRINLSDPLYAKGRRN